MLDHPLPDIGPKRHEWHFRHPLVVRLTHWLNVICLAVLLMSGLQIFNAHPALYWGEQSDFESPLLAMTAQEGGIDQPVGVTSLFGYSVRTTGALGVSSGPDGAPVARGFPGWMTLPSGQDLASGRRGHFLFAWFFVLNGFVYLLYGVITRHTWRKLLPSWAEMSGISHSVADHLRLRFPRGEEARHYNVLQKLTYLAVIFIVLPVLILAGLTMSPGMNAAFPDLVTLFGGRQSARTLHFVAAGALVLFIVVHVVLVLVSGAWNNMRSMLTGWYAIATKESRHEPSR
jgi:thiosulfate reductase cytochrome b subunit